MKTAVTPRPTVSFGIALSLALLMCWLFANRSTTPAVSLPLIPVSTSPVVSEGPALVQGKDYTLVHSGSLPAMPEKQAESAKGKAPHAFPEVR